MNELRDSHPMLEATSQLRVDWDRLPEAYGLGKLMDVTGAMPTVAQVRWTDESGKEQTWVGMYEIGKEASEGEPEQYAAFASYEGNPQNGMLRLEPYLPATHAARIAIGDMFDESDALVGISPTEDQSRFTWPEGDALKIAYDVVRQRITEAYLWMGHPDLVDALEKNNVPFKQVTDVAFMTRAAFTQ